MKDRIRKLCPDLIESMVDDFTNIAALFEKEVSSFRPILTVLELALNQLATKMALLMKRC